MMYVLFCVNRKKAVLDYFWISILVSYVYRIYYLLHPYILSPLMIFSYLLLLNTFYSFQIGKGQTWSKWVTIILMPVLGLGIVEITGNSDIGNLIPS